jgi:hypothetical protein
MIRNLHKIHWLVIDKDDNVLVEVQSRGYGDSGYYQAAYMKRAEKAVGSGYYHLTNYGNELPVNPTFGTADGILTHNHRLEALRGYLFYSHGPSQQAAIVDKAAGIIRAPDNYKGGSYARQAVRHTNCARQRNRIRSGRCALIKCSAM